MTYGYSLTVHINILIVEAPLMSVQDKEEPTSLICLKMNWTFLQKTNAEHIKLLSLQCMMDNQTDHPMPKVNYLKLSPM